MLTMAAKIFHNLNSSLILEVVNTAERNCEIVYIIISSCIKIMLAKNQICKLTEDRPIFFAPKKETGHTNRFFPH